ncbi:MAG: hypothetical protein POELPBGB_01477 [Bacteroidia bacterium]|nr:hypothetical protein [Bacteroidia bacterium]
MKKILAQSLILLSLFFITGHFSSCKKDDCDNDSIPQTEICRTSNYPIVMMHGFLASGDTWANHAMRFSANGYDDNMLYAFDWNSINQGNSIDLLDDYIDEILAATGAQKVDLIGHSAGGGLGYTYLSDSIRATKVAHYVHVASSVQSGPAGSNGEVPTLNLWSEDDEIAAGGDIPGATNVKLTGADHYQVATNAESFAAIFSFFNNGKTACTTNIEAKEPVQLSGRSVTLGENSPMAGATIEIYEVSSTTGERVSGTADAVLTTDSKGYWGPFSAKSNTRYEFRVVSADPNDRVVHYFREGAIRSNKFVYLRTFPPAGSTIALLLNGVPENATQSAVVVFSSSQAVINGRDSLSAGGVDLSSAQYASPAKTAIAYFLYDDGDSQTSGNPVGFFGSFSFLNGVDIFFPASPPSTVSVYFNGRTLYMPSLSSADGVLVPVFD